MVKLIVSDVDGTLLPEGTAEINPEIYEVVLRLKERGIVFAVASGRQEKSIKSMFAPISNDIYFISNNGGCVTYRNSVLVCRTFKRKTAKDILDYVRRIKNAFYLVTTPEGDYTDCQDSEMMNWLQKGYRIYIDRICDVMGVADRMVKISAFVKERCGTGGKSGKGVF